MLPYACSTPQSSATCRERSGVDAITPKIWAPASIAARLCTSPIIPAPSIATRLVASAMPERLVLGTRMRPSAMQNGRVGGARILVVEDSDAIRLPVVAALVAHGFELAAARTESILRACCRRLRPIW
jgi:hypothetical protein